MKNLLKIILSGMVIRFGELPDVTVLQSLRYAD